MRRRQLVEVWCFIRQYRDVLNVPRDIVFPFDRITLFDEAPTSDDGVERVNAYQFLLQFLLAEEAKHAMTLRKQMREVDWVTSGLYGCARFAGLCDASNFPSFLRGFFDKHCFDVEATQDPEQRMILVLLQLMRHPDCFIFLRPVDEERHDVPGYAEMVKHPMDFGTICRRLAEGWYDQSGESNELNALNESSESNTSNTANTANTANTSNKKNGKQEDEDTRGTGLVGVVRDIFLIYANCRLYNGSDSSAYRYCQKMLTLTEALLRRWVEEACVAKA